MVIDEAEPLPEVSESYLKPSNITTADSMHINDITPPTIIPTLTPITHPASTDLTTPNPLQPPQDTPQQLLDLIVSTNFDVISIPCIMTVSKYIANILAYPNDTKYRIINMKNKVFIDKISTVSHALAYLASIGFVASQQHPLGTYIEYPPYEGDLDILRRQRAMLNMLMERLGVPVEQRPWKQASERSQTAQSSSSTGDSTMRQDGHQQPGPEFDPCKPLITRNAVQVS